MKDKEFEFEKRRIKKLSKFWILVLGLRWWKIDIRYYDERRERSDEERAQNWIPLLDVRVKWEYKYAAVNCYLPDIVGVSDEDLEKHFVHELCHVLVNEMRSWRSDSEGMKHEERVVTTLADAFIWLKQELRKKKKK